MLEYYNEKSDTEKLALITEIARAWVAAVDRDTSWDSWDHYYKQMKYEILSD